MPLYEYQCDACGHRFEKIQKYSDPPADTCPKCGGSVQKLLSSPAIQFKGSGWYITDYARKSGGGGEKASTSSNEKASSSEKSSTTNDSSTSTSSSSGSTTATKTE